ELGGVVDDLALQALRQLRLDVGEYVAHARYHFEQIRRGRNLDPDINGLLAVEAHLRLVVLGAKRHVGDVVQPDDRAALLLDDEVLELLDGANVRRRGEVYLDHLALGRTHRRQALVGGERRAHV